MDEQNIFIDFDIVTKGEKPRNSEMLDNVSDYVKPQLINGIEFIYLADVYKALGLEGCDMNIQGPYNGWVKDDEGKWHFGFIEFRHTYITVKTDMYVDGELITTIYPKEEL